MTTTTAYNTNMNANGGNISRIAPRPARYASARSARRTVAAINHEIAYTDRIYARLTLAGRVIVEFTKDRISDLSALLLLLRAMTPTRRGLAKLTIRNMTRGWRMERPLMLYPAPCCPTASVTPMPYDY